MNRERSEAKAAVIRECAEAPSGRLQSELTWRFLTRHIVAKPERERDTLDILDVGAGLGLTSMRLAEQGHRVTLLEPSVCLLETVAERARTEMPEREPNLAFLNQRIEDMEECEQPRYDLVLCHETIEYVDDPLRAFEIITRAIRPRGLLSLVFRSRYGEVMRQAMELGRPADALAAFTADRFQTEMHSGWGRLYSREELEALLAPLGYGVVGEYGIRVLCDYMDCSMWADEDCFRGMLELEERAGSEDPYRDLARFTHLVCLKD
ncbi:MAG: methyltransferase domain-containing protein [Candidatus Geothermincolia bacterium]